MLTNGTVYGRIIHLAKGLDESEFHEIPEEEYYSLTPDGEPSEDEATEADYISALGEFGVKV